MITLPWPDKILSPNARPHWAAKAKAVKNARELACYTTIAAGCNREKFAGYTGKIILMITFYPKTARIPDDDNCLSSFKAYRDGISDAIGIDDKYFSSRPVIAGKGGYVEVVILKALEK